MNELNQDEKNVVVEKNMEKIMNVVVEVIVARLYLYKIEKVANCDLFVL
jgi:hypothetical protein